MKVDLRTLLKVNGNTLDVHLKGSGQDFEALDFELKEVLDFDLQGKFLNVSGVLKLKGKMSFSYEKNCDRCLKIVDGKVENELDECFYSGDSQLPDAEYFYMDKSLDFSKFIMDQIIMSFPTRHICSESCKGICPQCGIDLNEENCRCEVEDVDPRLSKFKDLLDAFEGQKKNS
jgi:uncharacterized protein